MFSMFLLGPSSKLDPFLNSASQLYYIVSNIKVIKALSVTLGKRTQGHCSMNENLADYSPS